MSTYPFSTKEHAANPAKDAAPPPRRATWGELTFLILPLLAHAVMVAITSPGHGRVTFGKLDLIVLLAAVGYGCAVAVAAGRGYSLPRFLLVTYLSLFGLGALELVARRILPPFPAGLPWVPMRNTWTVGDKMPGVEGQVELTVNSLGLRGPEVNLKEMDLKILCIGGSTTECLYVTDPRTWTWRVQDTLAERLGKKVFVGNAGRSGHLTLHHDHQLNNYKYVPDFDWVVVLCGINDLGSQVNRQDYDYRVTQISEEALTQGAEIELYYRRLGLTRMLEKLMGRKLTDTRINLDLKGDWHQRERDLRQAALKKKTLDQVPQALLDKYLPVYRQNLQNIIATCRRSRKNLVMMTQPSLWRKGLSPDLDAMLWIHAHYQAYTVEVLEQIMAAYNQTMKDVCREQGVPCIDLAALLPKDATVFYDDVHFNTSGCDKVARIVSDWLLEEVKSKK